MRLTLQIRRDSCVDVVDVEHPFGNRADSRSLAERLSPSFASRPCDRFAFLEDDDAAGSSCDRLPLTGAYPRAPRESRHGEEKRSLANACSVHRPEPLGLTASRLHLKPMSGSAGCQRNPATTACDFVAGAPAQSVIPHAAAPRSAARMRVSCRSCGILATYRCVETSFQRPVQPRRATAPMSCQRSAFSDYLERLAAADRWTYRAGVESAAEPAAWAAIALAGYGEADAAARARRLARRVCSRPTAPSASPPPRPSRVGRPASPCSRGASSISAASPQRFRSHIERAAAWSLADRGKTAPRSPQIGHDTTLVGWSWAADTASWLEPTCFFVLGLDRGGLRRPSARARKGVRLIADRLLPDGGANYGNTIVLGQPLLPHVAADAALAMSALAGAADRRTCASNGRSTTSKSTSAPRPRPRR